MGNSSKAANILAAAVLVYAVFWLDAGSGGRDPVPEPVAELRRLVDPIRKALREHEAGQDKANRVAVFYRQWLDMVEGDNGNIIQTTGLLRSTHIKAIRMMDLSAEPAIFCHIDAAMEAWLGMDNAPFDQTRQERALEFFRGLCWAAEEER